MKINKCVVSLAMILLACSMLSCAKKVAPVGDEVKLLQDKQTYMIGNQGIASVTLPENGTTGYSWFYMISDETILAYSSDSSKPADVAENVVGGGSIHTWKFKAISPGTTTLKFAYCRAWEAKAIEDKIAETTNNIKLKEFTAKWQVAIETREFLIEVK